MAADVEASGKVVDPKTKYYDQFGRTRVLRSRGWRSVCTHGTCMAQLAWTWYPKISGPSLTGFNMCKKHEETTQTSSVQQGLSAYFPAA
jgi:hypothetical protein